MRISRTSIIVCCLSLMLLASASVGSAGDKKITKNEIPAAVLKAFEARYPHAAIKGQAIETEGGKQYYEIESKDGKISRDLLYTPEGKVVEIEEAMEPGTLPEAVRSALAKEYPKGKIVKAEKATHDSTVTYEIRVQIGKKTSEVAFDAAGTMMKAGKKADEKGEKDDDDEDDE